MQADSSHPDPATTKASTLDRAMRHGPVDYEQAASLVGALCQKAARAHDEGLAYGGLSPASVTINQNLDLTITIEPLKGPLEDIDHVATDYIAPEVLAGDPCTPRSDVYSLARILYRLITGATPEGNSPPPPSSISKTPLVLDTIIKRATSIAPNDRISSAEKLGNDLRQTAQTRPAIKGPEAPITPIRRSHEIAATPAQHREKTNPLIPWGIITKTALALVLLALVATLASRFASEDKELPSRQTQVSNQTRELAERPDPFAKNPAPRKSVPDRNPALRSKPAPRERLKDSLARLKIALASGDRSELPPEAVRRNDSSYALWERTMTWKEAKAFAEAHGAHLAILRERKDREWAKDRFDMRYPAWLGAGKGANDQWYWLDGTALPAGRSVGKVEDWHLALNEKGILMPANPERKCDVLLEWRDDGDNPGTEQEQLQRAKTLALSGDRPSLFRGEGLPIGTRSFGGSHFYAVRTSMISWGEALDFAATHGAYLAVPSNSQEHEWICSNFWDYLGTGEGLWIGGFRSGPEQPWGWISGEAWHGAGLVQGGNPHPLFDRILLQGGGELGEGRWTMVEGSRRKAPGILLEWTAPGSSTPAQNVRTFNSKTWLAAINRKTQQLVGSDLSSFAWSKRKLVEKYERELTKHIREAKSAFRSTIRRPGQDQTEVRGSLEKLDSLEASLEEATANGELLPSIALDGVALQTTQKQAVAALEALEEKYDSKIKALQEDYRAQLETRASSLLEEGHLEKASQLRNAIRPLKPDLKAFLRLLYPENPDRATLPWEPRKEQLEDPE